MLVFQRAVANVLVTGILASSAYAIYVVVERSRGFEQRLREGKSVSWVEQNEVGLCGRLRLSIRHQTTFDFSITFPSFPIQIE